MREAAICLIRVYQKALSSFLRAQCKYYPTCSEYAVLSIRKYGLLRGGLKASIRLIRCNPFSDGGIDFP
ncbi:MAG: membrane protein insertion efficiency factor YidD [Holosporaceae bacterium]|nr:membrane protein insertion efficiency factor YidD [Holosporaceae bacterium]